jgi:hypothetical protein
MEERKKMGLLPQVILIGGIIATGVSIASEKKETSSQVNSIPREQPITELTPRVASGIIYQSSTPTPEISKIGGWSSCVTINREAGIPDAFTAIGVAGVRGKWETGPYGFFSGSEGKTHGEKDKVVDNWNELNLVYNGDKICVNDP